MKPINNIVYSIRHRAPWHVERLCSMCGSPVLLSCSNVVSGSPVLWFRGLWFRGLVDLGLGSGVWWSCSLLVLGDAHSPPRNCSMTLSNHFSTTSFRSYLSSQNCDLEPKVTKSDLKR